MSRRRIELLVLGILIIAIILYAGTGIVYSGVLVASSERTLNNVVSHQNTLNTSFNAIDSEVRALNSSGNFNPQQEVTLVDKSIANSQLAMQTINQDDASLVSTEGQLNGSRWLTAVGRSSIDRESARLGHARNALAAARTIAADEALDGLFWHSLYSALGDLDLLSNQSSSGDLTAAKSTLATMKSDVDQAVQRSAAPALPSDLHNLMVDMQTFAADFGKQLDAQIAGDDASVAQYQASLDADRTRLGTYDIDKIGTAIDAFYRPLLDRFNSEIAAATA
ncbi:MAG TPA: hypothetical protein VLK30_00935 [Candidatus Limnocylindrales bacterium]|nr:hypothetical protein [Candidatus Limnocylindrales bacterium]